MKRALGLATAVLVSSFFLSSSANAQGFALNRFDPSERGSEWFANESLDLRGHVRPALGVVLDWARDPLVLYQPNGDVDKTIVENQVFLHAGGAITLWSRLRLGVNVPVAVYQNGDTGTLQATGVTFGAPETPSIGDVRVGGDVRLVGEHGEAFTLAFGVHGYIPSGSRSGYTGDGTFRLQPRLTAAGDLGPLTYAAKAAVQYRPRDVSFGQGNLGSELLFSGALGIRALDRRLVIGPEIYGSTVMSDAFSRLSSPLEGLFGAHLGVGDIRLGAGAGLGLTRGFGSPAFRVVGVVEWAPPYEEAPGDRDKDGVVDKEDACPDVPGVKTSDPATNGCPADRDKDGILDKDDACPDVPGVRTEDRATNGCPPDRDKDGILDKDDACPDVPGVKTDDPKTNGCPTDPDRDKDGILNENDACPDEPGKPDTDPKKNGCPKAFISGGQIRIIDQVKFTTGSAAIVKGKDSDEVLEAVLKVMKEHPEITKVRVEGHTDNRGPAKLNKDLSAARAASVVNWLTGKGIDAGRLTSAGFGSDRPLDSNESEDGRRNNRRVEFHIEGGSSPPGVKPAP